MEDLVSEKKVNKKKIKKTMMEMVYLQLLTRLNQEFPVRTESHITDIYSPSLVT
jgi:hypothetical protein